MRHTYLGASMKLSLSLTQSIPSRKAMLLSFYSFLSALLQWKNTSAPPSLFEPKTSSLPDLGASRIPA